MVLQDINDVYGGDPNSNQNDPYSSTSPSGQRFDASNLPQPIPVLGSFMGFSPPAVRFKTETTIKFAEKKLGRPLDASEAQALAFHIYKLEQTKSYFAATGTLLGAFRAQRTMPTNKYPFYQPKPEDVNPNKFGFIKGPMAQYARHTWRFSLYMLVAGQMGSIIGQLIAQPLAAVNTSQDPKLERFGNELKAAAAAEQGKIQETGREIQERRREFERQKRDRDGMGPAPQSSWGRQGRSGARGDDDDDMSPTAGNEAWGSSSSSSSSSGAWDSFSAQSEQQSSGASDAWNRRTMGQNRASPPAQQSSSPFDDDASPTGGLFQDEVTSASQSQTSSTPQPQPQSRPGESAWDRLRRGGPPVPTQRPTGQNQHDRERRDQSPANDGFGLGGDADEERRREREVAQREFDERIERERQGRDFDDKGGRRW